MAAKPAETEVTRYRVRPFNWDDEYIRVITTVNCAACEAVHKFGATGEEGSVYFIEILEPEPCIRRVESMGEGVFSCKEVSRDDALKEIRESMN